MAGRPTSYTKAVGDEICQRLIDGESLRAICRLNHMPERSVVMNWYGGSDQQPDLLAFRAQYARAREEQAHYFIEESLEISDDGENDWMERKSEAEKGAGYATGWVINGEHIQRSRLRVDTRKWIASKVLPKIYGDKIEHSGDPNSPIAVTMIERTIVDPKK